MEEDTYFQHVLISERAKLGISQEELAAKLSVDVKTVSRWEQGKSRPRLRNLYTLAKLFGKDIAMMGAPPKKINSRKHSSSKQSDQYSYQDLHSPGGVLPAQKESKSSYVATPNLPLATVSPALREDWDDAPRQTAFYGRHKELMELRQWIVDNNSKIIAILGMGGIGKTVLSINIAEYIKDFFSHIIWRSLENVPRLEYILPSCIQFISNQRHTAALSNVGDQISLLLQYLQTHRCLVIFDNFEAVLQPGLQAGYYREGYESYGKLIQRIGETEHKSCLLLTSREKPEEVARLEGRRSSVRSMYLQGLEQPEGRELLKDKGLSGSLEDWVALTDRCSGNPLTLKLISEPIQALFDSDIARFLQEKEIVFGDVNALLEQQFSRLSEQERELLYWFAIERESVSLQIIRDDLVYPIPNKVLLENLNSLRRRSMIEVKGTAHFFLQPVIMEYVTAHLVERFLQSFEMGATEMWSKYAMIKALSKDYVRDGQMRLILVPIAERLCAKFGKEAIKRQLRERLLQEQKTRPLQNSYIAGNVLNLLLYLQCDLSDVDFSRLVIRQAYLSGYSLSEVNFAYAHFISSIFANISGSILSVVFSPSEDLLAVGTATGDILFYQASSGIPLLTCTGHTDGVWSVTFSPDGKMLASGSDDQTVRLWDVKTGYCIRMFEGHANRVRSIAFSPDGKVLISVSEDQTIRIWDIVVGENPKVLQAHADRIWSVAFSPDGKMFATASTDQTVKIWDTTTEQCLKTLHGHAHWVLCVCFSPDGKYLASGGDDRTIRLWKVSTGQCFKVLHGHMKRVRSVAFNPDGTLVASGSEDQVVRLWDSRTGECLKILEGHTQGVRSVAFNIPGDLLASGGDDQTVRIWDVGTGRCHKTLQGYTNRIWGIAFSSDGRMLASCSEDHAIRLWNRSSGECIRTLQDQTHGARSIGFSPDGQTLVSGGEDRTVRVWDTSTGYCLKALSGHTHWIRAIACSSDGQTVASGGEDKVVRIWNRATGRCLRVLRGHTNWIRTLAFSPDGQLLASGGDDHMIYIWKPASSGVMFSTLQGHTSQVRSVAFSPDGQLLASGGEDQTIRLWNVSTGACLKILEGHTNWIRTLAFSPDGQLLASGGDDQTLRLWDVHAGLCQQLLEGHTNRIRSVAFDATSTIIASSGDDGLIKFWDSRTARCLETLVNERAYERMNITGAQGLTEVQKITLKVLGAVE